MWLSRNAIAPWIAAAAGNFPHHGDAEVAPEILMPI
jgi:hypothetical protein